MAVAPGVRLTHYEVGSLLGSGGMGEVYQARDKTLARDVALKVIANDFARDPERLARFEREARLLASLNHPNIAAIHSFEREGDVHFLVMELATGRTLAEILSSGPLALDEALSYGRQLAEALEAAHEKGVVHRDLKPANVKISDDGRVKVLDFGLAKAFGGEDTVSSELSRSPTLTRQATAMGVILGTAAYMSPEQARGKSVDKKTDIWSFGVILYESLSGRPLFEGQTASDIMASVLRSEIDWSALPPATPTAVKRLLRRCLERDTKKRYHDVADVRLEIDEALAETPSHPVAEGSVRGRTSWIAFAGVGAVSAAVAFAIAYSTRPSTPRPITHFSLELPRLGSTRDSLASWRVIGFDQIAISPDGRDILFVGPSSGRTMLFRRSMENLYAEPIAGTEGAVQPFFSPDGRWVGFFSEGSLKKVPLDGGAPLTLADGIRAPAGTSWGEVGRIVFAEAGKGLLQVRDTGGPTEVLVPPPASYPLLLPGEGGLVYTSNGQIKSHSLTSDTPDSVLEHGTSICYIETGHLLFARRGSVFAIAFDPQRMETSGSAFPVLQSVAQDLRGGARLDVSREGTLVYAPNWLDLERSRLVLVDRGGGVRPIRDEPRSYLSPRFSPDGERIAVTIFDEASVKRDVWVYDRARDGLARLTVGEGTSTDPAWSPDGKSIAFSAPAGDSGLDIFMRSADGAGEPARLTSGSDGLLQFAREFSPDGTLLVFHRIGSSDDIGVISLGDHSSEILLGSPFREIEPSLSPNGRFLAYVSDESGRREVYVRPFRGEDRRWQVSTDGGDEPSWSPSGDEIFYRSEDAMMGVEVETEPEFHPGRPALLFEGRFEVDPFSLDARNYDVAPDGSGFLMVQPMGGETITPLRLEVVLNWFEELKRKMPAKN